ncbi:MAG: 3-deoxy-D-manno-octulosonic acid transferase [Thermoguttaceae bacterium]|nr:3-deoxy-D-manno-octulosonic acid transferase [Thermoguttaceae bacterium]
MLDLVYLLTLLVALPFLLWRSIRTGKYRDGWGQKLFGAVPKLPPVSAGKKRLWFHAVSVGEVNLLNPIVSKIERDYPDWEFVVSSTSKTGLELARKLFSEKTLVFYCPLDFSWATRRAIRRIGPSALVLVELELWPNLIRAAKKSGAKVVIINGRIGDGSFRPYRRIRKALAPTFRRIDRIVAQDEVAANYFRELTPNPERVVATGSIKFDGAKTDRDAPEIRALAELAGIRATDALYLCGSTQSPEESGAIETYRRLYREFPELKLMIVPRHKERFEEVAALLDASEFQWTRRSTLVEPVDPSAEASRIILVDALGELGRWWGTAKIAFVGGSWGNRGGQNMLEPAGYGVAVSFGPNTRNFRTIVETLLRADAAKVVANVDEATEFVRTCLLDPEYRRRLGDSARVVVSQGAGATDRALTELARALEN